MHGLGLFVSLPIYSRPFHSQTGDWHFKRKIDLNFITKRKVILGWKSRFILNEFTEVWTFQVEMYTKRGRGFFNVHQPKKSCPLCLVSLLPINVVVLAKLLLILLLPIRTSSVFHNILWLVLAQDMYYYAYYH